VGQSGHLNGVEKQEEKGGTYREKRGMGGVISGTLKSKKRGAGGSGAGGPTLTMVLLGGPKRTLPEKASKVRRRLLLININDL